MIHALLKIIVTEIGPFVAHLLTGYGLRARVHLLEKSVV